VIFGFTNKERRFYFGHDVYVKTFGCFMVFFDAETGDDAALVCRVACFISRPQIWLQISSWVWSRAPVSTYAQIHMRTRPHIWRAVVSNMSSVTL